ncbi:MAG: pilus assembly protein N-terminal domain-containing protein [Hyphomonadaceae bacterium]|nr:pilus assembly protein N-terminal domain-containing protein [Hyphomonadaceae bacterium]
MANPLRRWIAASVIAASFMGSAMMADAWAEDIQVPLDMAAPVRLSAPAEGIAVGNPSIIGVSVQNERLIFVTGRAYGQTNLVVIGRGGRTLFNGRVMVTPDESGQVTVTRGVATERLSCNPICRPRPDIGDSVTSFAAVDEQVNRRATAAQTSGPANR